MGHLHVDVDLISKGRLKVQMLVDTGATYSILPIDLARRLGIAKAPRRVAVELADGRRRRMAYGSVLVRLLRREAVATALLGARGVEPVLGVEVLEALGLAVDPRRGRLVPTRTKAVLAMGARTLRRPSTPGGG